MAVVYVVIHNQNDVAMSSINGELVLILVARDGVIEAQQPVDLRTATATFQDVPAGNYTIVARHPDLIQQSRATTSVLLKTPFWVFDILTMRHSAACC